MPDAWLIRIMTAAHRRARAVLVGAVLLALLGVLLVTRVSFDADILRLLPRDSPAVQSFRTFLESFGSLDHLYVVFEAEDGIAAHEDFVDAYIAGLRRAPEVASVDSQLLEPDRDWTYLGDRVLFMLDPGEASAALARFRPPRLDAELAHARDLLSMPSPEIRRMVQEDPVGLFGLLRQSLEKEKGGLSIDPTQAGYVSRDGRSRLVIVEPRGAPFDSDFCKALFARLATVEETARAAIREASNPVDADVGVQTAGSYRIALEAERVIRRESITNAIGSLVLLLAVVLLAFRTPWVLIFGTVPLAMAAVLSLGLNGLFRGTLSPATSGSAGMLFGLGIDGVVLLYLRFMEERDTGAEPLDAISRMGGTASSVVLAQVTTVATFLALLWLDFPSLNDLGSLVGFGMLLVCPLTLVLLPAMLPRRRGKAMRHPSAPWLGRFVTGHASAIVIAGVLITMGLGVAARSLRVDTGISRLQARTPGVQFQEEIAARFGLPDDVLLVVHEGPELEPLLAAEERLQQALAADFPAMTMNAAGLLLPSQARQRAVAERIQAADLDPSAISRDLAAAGQRVGFRPGTFDPFVTRLPRVIDPDQRITFDGLSSHGLDPVISRFLVRRDAGFAAVAYLYPNQPVDLAALERTVQRADPGFALTGLTAIDRDLAVRFLPEFLRGILIGTSAVAVLLYLMLRSLRLTLLALLPPATGFLWSAGLLALFGVQLDLFSLFATVTFVGMAVDYGIYVVHRVAREGQPIGEVLTHTGVGVVIACLTALVGFGTLVHSSYPPLRTFGVMSVVTLTCCLLSALLFLPAVMLRVPSCSRPAR